MFIYYLLNAYFLVILPLPDLDSVPAGYREMIQLRPFQFVFDWAKESSFVLSRPETYLKAITEPVFTQVLFNILMTIPFGIMLRFYFKKNLKTTILYSFLLSLFFEISQLTGLFFIYPGPYRLFDIDDLILNTLGGALGYTLTPLIPSFIPQRQDIDLKNDKNSGTISLTKRALAYLLDSFIISTIVTILELIVNRKNSSGIYFIVFMLYFTLFTCKNRGQTPAQKFLSLRTNHEKDKLEIQLSQILLKSLLVYLFIEKGLSFFNLIEDLLVISNTRVVAFVYLIMFFSYILFFSFYWIMVWIRKPKQIFIDQLSKTKVISTYIKKEA